jgi:hypothetical protein
MATGASGTTSARSANHPAQRPVLDWTIDRIMAVLASVMLPVGVVLVVLGWWGAARTPFVFEQIPYMISGGLLGVGLLTAGGLLYVGSWLSKLAEVQRDEGEKTRDMLSGMRDDLRMLPHAMGGSMDGNGSGRSIFTPRPNLVATRTGSMYHVEGCSVVAGRNDLREVTGDEEGLKPCKLCQPDAEPAMSSS